MQLAVSSKDDSPTYRPRTFPGRSGDGRHRQALNADPQVEPIEEWARKPSPVPGLSGSSAITPHQVVALERARAWISGGHQFEIDWGKALNGPGARL